MLLISISLYCVVGLPILVIWNGYSQLLFSLSSPRYPCPAGLSCSYPNCHSSPWSQPSRTGRSSKVTLPHQYRCSYLKDRPPVTAIPAAGLPYCSPRVFITRKSAELRTENTEIGAIDLQDVNLSFIPTKSNHPEGFSLRDISPLKVSLHRITLDASSYATLADVKRGVCCGHSV